MIADFIEGEIHDKLKRRREAPFCLYGIGSPLEFPVQSDLAIDSALLAGPAVDVEINVEVVGSLCTEAEFEHAAAAPEGRTRGGCAVVGRPGIPAELILIRKARIDVLTCIDGVDEAGSNPQTVTVYTIEGECIRISDIGGYGCGITALMGVEVFQIGVHLVLRLEFKDLADAKMCGTVLELAVTDSSLFSAFPPASSLLTVPPLMLTV